jgi:hypothetical protein
MWLTKKQVRLGRERAAEAARECGILWLVFSLLDKIVDGTITFPWFFANVCFSVAMWFAGMYIEFQAMNENE